MFLLFQADLLLSVVHALLLLFLGQGGEEAGSSIAPLQSEKLHFKYSSVTGILLVGQFYFKRKPCLTIPVCLELVLTLMITFMHQN